MFRVFIKKCTKPKMHTNLQRHEYKQAGHSSLSVTCFRGRQALSYTEGGKNPLRAKKIQSIPIYSNCRMRVMCMMGRFHCLYTATLIVEQMKHEQTAETTSTCVYQEDFSAWLSERQRRRDTTCYRTEARLGLLYCLWLLVHRDVSKLSAFWKYKFVVLVLKIKRTFKKNDTRIFVKKKKKKIYRQI